MIYIKTTKQILTESLLQLLETTDLEKISVQKIADNCNLTRRTFYNYFLDKADITKRIINQEEEVFSGKEHCKYDSISSIMLYKLSLMRHYQMIYMHILNNSFGYDLFCQETKRQLVRWMKSEPGNAFFIDFFVNAYSITVLRWLQSKKPITALEMMQLILDCVPFHYQSWLDMRIDIGHPENNRPNVLN